MDATTDKIKAELNAHNAKIEQTRTQIFQDFGPDALDQFDQRLKINNNNKTNASPNIGVIKAPTKVDTPPKFDGKLEKLKLDL